MHVVATAGHVDHGKSTLLRTLTGMEPDRWDEERRRGLTIDLGFVWTDLEVDGETRTVAFVDVPGHERFVPNMLAGAGAVGLALFVVAADDGWSAQSQEHLEILDLLGVRAAVAAVTKVAAAGEDRALEVAADVERRLAATTLAGAPVVLTDALAGIGIDELRTTLTRRLAAEAGAEDRNRARLWVDRAFTVSGAGTVVTGTLQGGPVRVGDDVAVLPAGRTARVRGMHALGAPVEVAWPPARVALNLSGIDRDAIGRGDAVVTGATDPADAWLVTRRIDTWVRALVGHEVGRSGAWHLHVGSAETTCTVHPLLGEPVPAGREGHVRILLDRPLPLQTGDRFVLREAGRRATVAGGEVLDPRPPGRVRGVDRRLERAAVLDEVRTGDDRLAPLLRAAGGARPRVEAAAAAGRRPDAPLPDDTVAVRGWLADAGALRRWRAAIVTAAEAHHEADPSSPGATREELTASLPGLDATLAAAVVDHLADDGTLRRTGTAYALPDRAGAVDDAAADRRSTFLAALSAAPLAPPRLADAAKEAGLSYQDVQRLEQESVIVRCGDVAFTREAVDAAITAVRDLHARTGDFTAAQAKDAWGTTRKYAIPLLEHLDATGVTAFDGRLRHPRPTAS
jgi:selenocysteine-specific elongation factor